MPTLAAWLHTLDPYAVMLWEGGPIRWYGLSYLAGFFLAFLLIRRVTRVGVSTLEPARAGDLVIALALGAVIGGRLGYVVFYKAELLTQFTGAFPWWGALDMMGGGMSFHGGMLGALVAAWWFARRHGQPTLFTFDLAAFAAPLGLACGRLANFINGELVGRPTTDPNFPLAVQFPQEIYDDPRLYQRFAEAYGPELPRNWLDRLQDGNEALRQAAAAVLPPRHPSQLYAMALEGLVVFVLLVLLWRKPRPMGFISGVFGVAYAVMRIIDEQFRMPDSHLGLQWLGLSRGQWLSIAMLIAGLSVIVVSLKRKGPAMGGIGNRE